MQIHCIDVLSTADFIGSEAGRISGGTNAMKRKVIAWIMQPCVFTCQPIVNMSSVKADYHWRNVFKTYPSKILRICRQASLVVCDQGQIRIRQLMYKLCQRSAHSVYYDICTESRISLRWQRRCDFETLFNKANMLMAYVSEMWLLLVHAFRCRADS